MGGMWIFPFIMIIVMLFVVFMVLGRSGFRPPWWNRYDRDYDIGEHKETPLEILKKRYAKGEITREEFERMKKDIL
jgi:putative membrane protein